MKIKHCFWVVGQQNQLKNNETGLDKNDGTLSLIFSYQTVLFTKKNLIDSSMAYYLVGELHVMHEAPKHWLVGQWLNVVNIVLALQCLQRLQVHL